jgi:hypothetical protein
MVHPPEVVADMDSVSQLLILTEGLLCADVEQAAGNAPSSVRQVDQSAALDALRKLESRLRSAEDEVSEFRLKVCVGIWQALTALASACSTLVRY